MLYTDEPFMWPSIPWMSQFSGAVCARTHWLAAALGKWALGVERSG